MSRQRLDADLVRRELIDDIAQAVPLIESGRITVNGAVASNPRHMVARGDAVELLPPPIPFVSRGGLKLAAALDRFGVDPAGRRCLDVGASTGGFTDCLLQADAASVVALDVGHGQLHPKLRDHPDVVVLERTHIRDATPELIGGRVSLATADLSFISVGRAVAPMVACCERPADLVVLVKPQFEAPKPVVDRGAGIVRDPDEWAGALRRAIGALQRNGGGIMDVMASPIRGARGNVEFLVHAVVADDELPPAGQTPQIESLIAAAVADAATDPAEPSHG